MAASNSIFLYITGGRTLWVPGHTPAPGETKPVHILNFASPRELSRSFYLFDMPIQLIDDPRAAALIPGGKTPEDVITAVNEFRRVCTEDQKFLLKRCYDANKPPPSPQNQPQSPPLQQLQQTQLLPGGLGTVDAFGMRQTPAFNAAITNPNQALLLQLLQQQQQQQQRAPVPQQTSPLQQLPPMTFNRGAMLGAGNAAAGGNLMMNAGGMMPLAPMMGYNNNYFNPMMPMGRSAGLMPAPNTTSYPVGPGMRNAPSSMMGGRGGFGRNPPPHSPFHAPVRDKPEALPTLPPIPSEILEIYMNPQQKLMCATMPGPRCTVWLREHALPTDTKNPRYVFCKGGIVLMLKTKGSEVANSKPVELFEQQVCAHFLIHNYCSRSNCLHRHHTETQLRQLIAGKHVELKSMTKKERHRLSERILEKEREGLARAAEDREQRAKERMEGGKRRHFMGGGGDNNNSNVLTPVDTSRPTLARLDIDSSDEGEVDNKDEGKGTAVRSHKGSGEQKDDANKLGESSVGRHDNEEDGKDQTERSSLRRAAAVQSRRVLNPADIGVTDSEGDDDDSSFSSSSSSPSKSSSRNSDKAPVGKDITTTDDKKEEGNKKDNATDLVTETVETIHTQVDTIEKGSVEKETHDEDNKLLMTTTTTEQMLTTTREEEMIIETNDSCNKSKEQHEEPQTITEDVEEGDNDDKQTEEQHEQQTFENISDPSEAVNEKKTKEKKGATKRTRVSAPKNTTTTNKRTKK